MAATTLPEGKPRQLQIARLRREEEEETWISGEELYTEGSSDEENQTTQNSPQSTTPSTTSTTTALSTTLTTAKSQICHQVIERRISAPAHLSRWQSAPKEASEPVVRDEPHLTETMRRFSEMGMAIGIPSLYPEGDNQEGLKKVEEQDEVMLWRPKRGSLKLPRIDLDSTPTRFPRQKVTG